MINSVPTGSSRIRHAFQHISLERAIIFIIQLILVVYLSFLTPLFLRYIFVAKFVERVEPLEFTFQTCKNLESICSFPEAIVALDENALSLQTGYQHSFTLQFTIFDTPQNRQLGVFIASLQLKDESNSVIANYNKGVPVLKAFPSNSIMTALLTNARNVMFLPLYLCGFFADNTQPELVSVHFPNLYLEKYEGRTKFIVAQLQNKYVQISSASLRIRAHVGLMCYMISKFPISSYIFLLTTSFGVYFTVFVLHWTYKGMNLLYFYSDNKISNNVSDPETKKSIINGSKKINDDSTKSDKLMEEKGDNIKQNSVSSSIVAVIGKEHFRIAKRNRYSTSEVPECSISSNTHG